MVDPQAIMYITKYILYKYIRFHGNILLYHVNCAVWPIVALYRYSMEIGPSLVQTLSDADTVPATRHVV